MICKEVLTVFLFSKIKLKSILKIFITYFLIYTSNILFNSKFTIQNNITGDVKDIHFQHVANIFEHSYFYSVNNPSLEGYTQLVAYIQALLHVIVKFSGEFVYMDSVLNVLFILTILFFLEIDFDYISKIILIGLYSIVVFNSEWIKFLFIDSLMTEGVLAYLFCVFVVSISNMQNVIYKKNSILFFFFGFLFFSKQFISLLSLFIIIFFLITKKYRFQSIVGLSAVIIKELSYISYFKNITKNYHLRDVDIRDFILDLLLLRDLKYSNLNEILRNLFFDKPIFLIFLYLIFLLIIYFSVYRLKEYDINFYTMIIFLNTCFVIILYLTLWKNMELESPIRYLLNLLLLKLVLQFKIIDKLKEVKH